MVCWFDSGARGNDVSDVGGLPDWLEAWFAERENECRARGVDAVLWIRPADGPPDRPGRKATPDAKVDLEVGSRWGNIGVFGESGVSLTGVDFVTEVAWQAYLHPQSPEDLDAVVDQALAWVEATAEMPSWAS